jgi:hypothetical protein
MRFMNKRREKSRISEKQFSLSMKEENTMLYSS